MNNICIANINTQATNLYSSFEKKVNSCIDYSTKKIISILPTSISELIQKDFVTESRITTLLVIKPTLYWAIAGRTPIPSPFQWAALLLTTAPLALVLSKHIYTHIQTCRKEFSTFEKVCTISLSIFLGWMYVITRKTDSVYPPKNAIDLVSYFFDLSGTVFGSLLANCGTLWFLRHGTYDAKIKKSIPSFEAEWNFYTNHLKLIMQTLSSDADLCNRYRNLGRGRTWLQADIKPYPEFVEQASYNDDLIFTRWAYFNLYMPDLRRGYNGLLEFINSDPELSRRFHIRFAQISRRNEEARRWQNAIGM